MHYAFWQGVSGFKLVLCAYAACSNAWFGVKIPFRSGTDTEIHFCSDTDTVSFSSHAGETKIQPTLVQQLKNHVHLQGPFSKTPPSWFWMSLNFGIYMVYSRHRCHTHGRYIRSKTFLVCSVPFYIMVCLWYWRYSMNIWWIFFEYPKSSIIQHTFGVPNLEQ